MCNRIIMFLTDGGTEMPEEVFQKYNWPDKPVRIEPSHTAVTLLMKGSHETFKACVILS